MHSINIAADELRAIIREEIAASSIPVTATDEILGIREAAVVLKLSVSKVYQMCQQKQIPYCKRTGRLYFLKPQLEKWMKDGQVNAVNEIKLKLV